jgi:hypothetical protein
MLGKAIDPSRIAFSEESRLLLGSDRKWRRIRLGAWNDTCLAERKKCADSVMIWASIAVDFRSAVHFYSNGIDATE